MYRINYKSEQITNLEKKIKSGNNDVVNNFWNKIEREGSTIIEDIHDDNEHSLVTFFYKGDENTENVVLIFQMDWQNFKDYQFERIADTNIWYITCKFRNDIRLQYFFIINDPMDDDWKKRNDSLWNDTLCANKLYLNPDDKSKFKSYVIMPNAPEEVWIKHRDNVSKGTLKTHKFTSNILKDTRDIWVYVPNDYNKQVDPYGVLVLNDGKEYLAMGAENVLDNLISDKKIPPIVTVFVESTDNRMTELMCSEDFASFTTEELMPWVRENFNITSDPKKSIIGGLSLGGLTASFLGLKHPELFGNVLSQSGSYWYKREDVEDDKKCNWMAKQFESIDKLNLKFYLNVGILEGDIMLKFNKQFRDTLINKGYDVIYGEFKSGHDYLCWGETLADGLIALNLK